MVESKGVGKTFAYSEWKGVENLGKMEYPSGCSGLYPLNYPVRAKLNKVVYSGEEVDYLAELRYPLTFAWKNLSMALLQKAVAEQGDSIWNAL